MTVINVTWRKVLVFGVLSGLLTGIGRGATQMILGDDPPGCHIDNVYAEGSKEVRGYHITCNEDA